ncbi:Immunoglobulin, partial [Oryctes borbonicus]
LLVTAGVHNSGGGGFNALPESATLNPVVVPASSSRSEPYFDVTTPKNVSALVGKSAYLSCQVRNLGNKTVSWIRHRDIHILTVGSYTYTSDQRFQANHHIEDDDWTLQIKWAQKRDSGIYECQISTQPVKSFFVNLNIVDFPPDTDGPGASDIYQQMQGDRVPRARILGAPDLHVGKGSTINLTCSVRYSPEPPAYMFWYHQDELILQVRNFASSKIVISYDSNRGGITVITEKGEVTTSSLLIQHADVSDSGKYSCSPSNADVASVIVHVLNGEQPAAMQTGSAGLSNSFVNILALITVLYLYNNICQSLQVVPAKFPVLR